MSRFNPAGSINDLLATANAKWRGYGTGTCQAEKSATFQYPRFFKAGAWTEEVLPAPGKGTGR